MQRMAIESQQASDHLLPWPSSCTRHRRKKVGASIIGGASRNMKKQAAKHKKLPNFPTQGTSSAVAKATTSGATERPIERHKFIFKTCRNRASCVRLSSSRPSEAVKQSSSHVPCEVGKFAAATSDASVAAEIVLVEAAADDHPIVEAAKPEHRAEAQADITRVLPPSSKIFKTLTTAALLWPMRW
mmetsp:Transcript_85516/g.187805  ORF Transcript_85516/g.187805 Transcript_85516/m.187805 type:complete len:186 (-) Transcript_85516:794-1351(-)